MTDYTVLSKFRNKESVKFLVNELRKINKSCYSFFDNQDPFTKKNKDPEERMHIFENIKNFYDDKHFQKLFKEDLDGLKNAEKSDCFVTSR